jgi:hypothetical protein
VKLIPCCVSIAPSLLRFYCAFAHARVHVFIGSEIAEL